MDEPLLTGSQIASVLAGVVGGFLLTVFGLAVLIGINAVTPETPALCMQFLRRNKPLFVAVICVVLLSAGIGFAGWIVSPSRYRYEKISRSMRGTYSFEYIIRIDTWTGEAVTIADSREPYAKRPPTTGSDARSPVAP